MNNADKQKEKNAISSIPPIIAGPILRHVSAHQLTYWLITSQAFEFSFQLFNGKEVLFDKRLTLAQHQQICIGKNAYVQLISIDFSQALAIDTVLHYQFKLHVQQQHYVLTELLGDLCYAGEKLPSFIIQPNIKQLLHGSCRKPHFDSDDGLLQVDRVLEKAIANDSSRPSMLMMSGDQIYADDVAGPTLVAIHQVISLLGLYDETFEGANFGSELSKSKVTQNIVTGEQLYQHRHCYYGREHLLPTTAHDTSAIFTSVHVDNHLITFAEVFAMYLLTWSPILWRCVDLQPQNIGKIIQDENKQGKYQHERAVLENFISTLPNVARALAHIPTYMIFDDHDITDDWNLTRGWEEQAYSHPFAKRIIGNALMAYWLCQGWGNAPEKFQSLITQSKLLFTMQNESVQSESVQNESVHSDNVESETKQTDTQQATNTLDKTKHEALIDNLLSWQQWHYQLATSPKVIVLDTRTQRWRSESNANKPSGLMDWESLSELQQNLLNQDKVIMVSAAPIYGVKLIETIQRVFTFFGKPLAVDAENWMAHKGTANVILNIFKHPKTPPNFIILSGDVHYSFFYDVTHRSKRNDSRIFQITASGIKNQFPSKLLHWLEVFNRYLYASYSPLNWFTKRRSMKIKVRKPNPNSSQTLVNKSGIGSITLTDDNKVVQAELLTVDDKRVSFYEK